MRVARDVPAAGGPAGGGSAEGDGTLAARIAGWPARTPVLTVC